MKTSQDLFQLIETLSKTEKTYIRKNLSLYKKQNIYSQLFEAIVKQKKYDEEVLLTEIYFSGDKKKLAVIKNQLHNMILDKMIVLHSGSSVANELRSRLSVVEFLFEKKLYDYCLKKLVEAKCIAQNFQRHLYLLEINRWEMKLRIVNFNINGYKKFTGTYFKEQLALLEKETNVHQYKDLECKLFYCMRNGWENSPSKTVVREMEQIVNDPLMLDENMALSYESRVILYNTLSIFYYYQRNIDKANEYALKLVEWHEVYPEIINDNIGSYARALFNLLSIHSILGKAENFTITVNKLKILSNEHPEFKEWIFEKTAIAELTMYGISGNIEEGMKLVVQIETKLLQHQGITNKGNEIDLFYNVALFLFTTGKYKRALHYINKILNIGEYKPLEDLISYAQILNLLIHYELGNIELLEYLIKSPVQSFKKKQKQFPVELSILELMKKLIHIHSKDEQMEYFSVVKTKLISLMNNSKLERKNVRFYKLIIFWLEKKETVRL